MIRWLDDEQTRGDTLTYPRAFVYLDINRHLLYDGRKANQISYPHP